MSKWVKAQIGAGCYRNVSEYFRNLVRRDQQRSNQGVTEPAQ